MAQEQLKSSIPNEVHSGQSLYPHSAWFISQWHTFYTGLNNKKSIQLNSAQLKKGNYENITNYSEVQRAEEDSKPAIEERPERE